MCSPGLMVMATESSPARHELRISGDRMSVIGPLTFATLTRPDRKTRRSLARVSTIDLSAVPFMDSAGVAQLIEWKRLALEQGRSLKIENLPDQARAIARICRVEDLLVPESVSPTPKSTA